MLDAYIIDRIKREEEKQRRENEGVQPSVEVDDFDNRPQIPEKKTSDRGVEDVTDWLRVELSGILGA